MKTLLDPTGICSLDDVTLEQLASMSLSSGDTTTMVALGGELERRGKYGRAWYLLAKGTELRKPSPIPLWQGDACSNSTLVVRRTMRHLGAELRMSRFLVPASNMFKQVILATEDRLVTLLQRTYPEVTVVPVERKDLWAHADFESSYERLAIFLGTTGKSIAESYRPLAPPPSRSADTHNQRIGIAWYSSNDRKPLPTLQDWIDALRSNDSRFTSLQYKEKAAGFDTLSSGLKHPLSPSYPIDQLFDVDGFCGQVADVAGVVTISNTTAHLAGMVGTPCIVILDDYQHLTWPKDGSHSVFYPNLITIRQKSRPWVKVIDDALDRLESLTAC
jgi:hypothetical protein